MNKIKDKNTHNVIMRWCDAFNDSFIIKAIKRRMQIDFTKY